MFNLSRSWLRYLSIFNSWFKVLYFFYLSPFLPPLCFPLVLLSCGKIFLQMRVAWMIGCEIRVSLAEFWDSTLDEFITGRLINCKSRFLHFPSTCNHKRWSKCQGFSSNNIFELPCLSVSSPLPLHFFPADISIFFTNLLIARIGLWYSSQVLIKPHLSPLSFWFLKMSLPSSPGSEPKVFR